MSFTIGKDTLLWRNTGFKIAPEPKLVGYFGVDTDKNYLSDSSRLRYYSPPSQREYYMDLNRGIESAVRRTGSSQEKNFLFKWINENHAKIQAPSTSNRWITPNFVCSRRVLMLFFSTPFLSKEHWSIHAAKWKGSVYLSMEKLKKTPDLSPDEFQKFASWGFKFEQYILSDAPGKDPETSEPVNEIKKFRCLDQRCFGSQIVLFCVAMKGVRSKKLLTDLLPLEDLEFVHLKTTKVIENSNQKYKFKKYKLLKWWMQNYLTNTNKVLCGFRNDEGIVRNLKSFSLTDMIKLSEGWNPTTCIDFCETFLEWVSKIVVNDCDRTIYKFERKEDDNCIKVTELSPTPEVAVIPTWFMEETRRV